VTAAGSRPAIPRSGAGEAYTCAPGRLRRAYATVPASARGSPRWPRSVGRPALSSHC